MRSDERHITNKVLKVDGYQSRQLPKHLWMNYLRTDMYTKDRTETIW